MNEYEYDEAEACPYCSMPMDALYDGGYYCPNCNRNFKDDEDEVGD